MFKYMPKTRKKVQLFLKSKSIKNNNLKNPNVKKNNKILNTQIQI